MPRLSILIPDGESPFAVHVLACLLEVNGLDIHLISKKARTLTRFSRLTRSFHLLRQDQSLLEGVAEVCEKYKIDLCMPVDTDGIYYFAQHRREMESLVKLAMIESAPTLRTVWDKGLLADFLFTNQLSHPKTITSREQFERDGSGIGFPVLIKPRLAGGGVGIEKFMDREGLLSKIGETSDFFDQYIIQSYIEGEDIDCSVLCKEGRILAYTIQKGLYANTTEYFQAPEAIEFLHCPDVLKIAADLLSALKWSGVAHIDLRRKSADGQVVLIEVNPRFWGSLEGSLYAGVNFAHLAVRTGLRETFPPPEYANVRYASALSVIKRKLKNKPAVSLFRETNLGHYLRDPLPVLARLMGVK